MHKVYRLGLLSLFISLGSSPAFAQYSPTVGDLNSVFDPPMNIQGIICGAFTDANQISVCKDGVAASRWMAEKYAKNAGSYLGCVDGISQGLNEGYLAGQNPTAEMNNNANSIVAGAVFTSAIARAQDQAKREGQTVSADQIIARYRAVIGKMDAKGHPVIPSKTYELPASSFPGYDDGYDLDVLSKDPSFNAVIQAGWVSNSDLWADRVAASKIYALQADYAARACSQNETIFGRRNMPTLSFWDYFRNRNKINFSNYGWNNADWAFEVLMNNENTLDTYITYTGIEKQTKQVTSQVPIMTTRNKLDANGKAIPKMGADGKQIVDAQGIPQFETETVQTGVQTVTNTVALSENEKQALRNSYLVGFKESYKRYYARQYASQNYHTVGLDKYSMGKEIGSLVGREVAQKSAIRNAYNSQYKVTSVGAYAAEVKDNYKKSFDYLINIFQNNPVLELNNAQVLGQVDDGIFRAGEELKVQFDATNLGEVSRPSTFSILASADVNSAQSGFSFTVPSLGSKSFTTGTLGRVMDSVRVRNQINVTFGLQNPGDLKEVAKSLVVQKNQPILINDYLEIDRAIPSLDYLNGVFTATVDVMNPANSTTPFVASKVELNLGAAGVKQSNVLSIPGGGTNNLTLSVAGVDPLAIIDAGGISGSVNTYVGDHLAHSVPVSASTNEDATLAKIKYFNALATRKTTNTGSVAMNDRLAQLMTLMNDITKQYIGRSGSNIRWDKDSEFKGTIIYQIQRMYLEASNAGRIDAQAQAVYTQLGQLLAQNQNQIKGGGFLRSPKSNIRAYLQQIKVFANI